jgi:glycosyltransferase involved in cell wall biosynthesis
VARRGDRIGSDNRHRLLFVSRKWPPAVGGMETYSVELAATLGDRFETRLLVLPGRPDGRPPGLVAYAGFVLRTMAFCLLRGRAFRRVVFTDLILFPAAVCHWLVAPRARRIVVVHGLDLIYQQRRGLLSLGYGVFFAAFRACQRVFACVVANSGNTATLAQRAGVRRVRVINPPLPESELTRSAASAADLPAGWPTEGRRILYFGRLVPRKGALWFAREVLPALPADCRLVVVGLAPDPAYGRALASCNRTICLGRAESPALAAMIRAADAVVMPNIATASADVEGFGLAAVEASAIGGRLLAAAIDGIPDAVTDNVTGCLLPPGDAPAWIAATRQALDGPAWDEAARASVMAQTRARYSRQRQLDAFLELLPA